MKNPSIQLPPPPRGSSLYTAIPLPPRKREWEKERFPDLSRGAEVVLAGRLPRKRAAADIRKRRNEFLQALGIALGINLLLVLGLLFLVIDSGANHGESFLLVEVVEDPEARDDPSASQSDPGASPSKLPSVKPERSRVNPLVASVRVANPTLTVQPNREVLDFPNPAFRIEQSVSAIDFAEIAVQKRKQAEEFVESRGTQKPNWANDGLAGTLASKEVLGTIFRATDLGDGSGAVVFLDVSGSMQGISRAVEAYLEKHFPGAEVRETRGCSMKQVSNPFPSALLTDPERDMRSDFYFICDLQDGESQRVISALRRFLTAGPASRRLHIVSFDRAPDRYLSGLLSTPGSSLTMARGLSDPKEP